MDRAELSDLAKINAKIIKEYVAKATEANNKDLIRHMGRLISMSEMRLLRQVEGLQQLNSKQGQLICRLDHDLHQLRKELGGRVRR